MEQSLVLTTEKKKAEEKDITEQVAVESSEEAVAVE